MVFEFSESNILSLALLGEKQPPRLDGVKAGDMLLMFWACKDDDLIVINESGWIEIPNTNPNQNYAEVRAFYKFATSDDQQCPSYSINGTSAQDVMMCTRCIKGVDSSSPIIDSANWYNNSTSNEIVEYPSLTATADNQLCIWIGMSDGDDIVDGTHSDVRKVVSENDFRVYTKVVTAGAVPSFQDLIPNKHRGYSCGFIFKDDPSKTIKPLDIQPIKSLTKLSPDVRNDSGWREAVYNSGQDIKTGENRVVINSNLKCYGTNNQWIIRIDNISDYTLIQQGETITINSDTGVIGEFKHYDYGSNRGYIYIYDWTGSVPNDNANVVFGTSGVTSKVWGNGSSYHGNVTGYIRSTERLNVDGSTYKIIGGSSLNISDGVYFVDLHSTYNNDNEGYWYHFVTDAKTFSLGTLIIPTSGSSIVTFNPYNMINVDVNYVEGEENKSDVPNDSTTKYLNVNNAGSCMSWNTPKDFSNKKIGIWTRMYNNNVSKAYCLAVDNNNKWKLFLLDDKNRNGYDANLVKYSFVDLDSVETPLYQSNGVFDVTQIKYLGLLFNQYSSSSRHGLYTYDQYEILTQTVTGADSVNNIVELKHIKNMINNEFNLYGTKFNDTIKSFIATQFVLSRDLILSCGLNINTKALDFPTQNDKNQNFFYNVDDEQVTLTFDNCSGDLTNSLVSSNVTTNIISQNGDVTAFSGTTFNNFYFKLYCDKIYKNFKLINCKRLELYNLSGIENVEVSQSKELSTNGAILIDSSNISNFKECDINNNVGYGVRIEGSTDFTLDNVTFNNNGIKDLYFSATTGTINVTIDNGGDVPTFDSAGVTVNILFPQTNYNLIMPNIVQGSRVQIYNMTSDTELDNKVLIDSNGFNETYIEDIDYEAGDVGRYRIVYQNGVNAKKEIEGFFTFPSITSVNSLPIIQEDQEVYIAYGVDGSTISEFTWDSGNLEIDVTDVDNRTVMQRIGAWYYYFISTATGIEELFGAIEWIKLNEMKNFTSKVNIQESMHCVGYGRKR